MRCFGLKIKSSSYRTPVLGHQDKVQQKYANNYDLCRRQLNEQTVVAKQSQTEAELLRRKVYSCNEELRQSRSNLSTISTADEPMAKELEKLQSECHSHKDRLESKESELKSYLKQNSDLSQSFECLQNSFELLKTVNCELEARGDNYWREQFETAKCENNKHQTQLNTIREELEELKQKFDDCSQDKQVLNEELMSAKEDIDIFSYQSKIATACAFVPLLMLLIAVLMAYYPSVSTVTGTTDL